MKKFFRTIVIIFILYCLLMSFLQFSNLLQTNFESDRTQVEIEKPKKYSNKEYIQLLKEICEYANVDIFYKTYNVNDGLDDITSYYVTDISETYLTKNMRENIERYGYVTNERGNESYMKYSDFFGIKRIYPFDDIVKYNLENAKFWIKMDDCNSFILECKNANITVSQINSRIVTTNYLSINKMLFPVLLLIINFIMYGISLRRAVYIKKINGYTDNDIIIENCKDELKKTGIPFVALLLLVYIRFAWECKEVFGAFFIYSIRIVALLCILLLFMFALGNKIVCMFTNHTILKGDDGRKYLFYITCVLQVVFAILFCYNINVSSSKLGKLNDIYSAYDTTTNDLKHYVTFPINTSNMDVSDYNQLEFNKKFDEFYEDTVDEFQGILIDTRNYRSIRGEETVAETFGDITITVNTNYIELQSICNINGEKITSDDLDEEKLNILLPESISIDTFMRSYNYYKYGEDDFHFLIYKNGTKFLTYNRFSGDGQIIDPVVYVYKKTYMENLMLNYISGEYYLAKCDNEKPYEVFSKYLKMYGLENIVPDTPYLENTFAVELANLKFEIFENVSMLVVNFAGYLAMFIFLIAEYVILHNKELYIKCINGYSKPLMFKTIIWNQIVLDILVVGFHLYFHFMLSTLLIYYVITKLLLVLFLKRMNILEVYHIWEL